MEVLVLKDPRGPIYKSLSSDFKFMSLSLDHKSFDNITELRITTVGENGEVSGAVTSLTLHHKQGSAENSINFFTGLMNANAEPLLATQLLLHL